jgi:glycosyltransferase involved in cell wall biosynthesis
MTKVAIIHNLTPKTNYARLLQGGFIEARHSVVTTFYGTKDEDISDLQNAKNVWSSNLYPFQIFKQVLKDRPNVVHIQYEFVTFGPFWTNLLLPLLLLLMKLARTKIVVTIHSVIPKEEVDRELVEKFFSQLGRLRIGGLLLKMYITFLYKTMIMSSDRTVVHGAWYKKALIDSYKATRFKIDIIPYGVEEGNGIDNRLLKSWKRRVGNRRIILFFGTVSPRKDIETLIRAFSVFAKKHSEYLLIIAGIEPVSYRRYALMLRSIVKQLDISNSVIFTGMISDEEIHVLYSISDFIVFPYLYSFEGPSGPLAFAIQHGLPIIGNKIGHLEEQISFIKGGILVAPRNVQALTSALTELGEDESLRHSLSDNLLRKRKGMLWKSVATRLSDVYCELTRQRES